MALMSEEAKKKISEKRKEYLKNNPDKHPWKRKISLNLFHVKLLKNI